MLPLGGCLLATDKPDPGLDIPQAYEYGPKKPAVAEAALPPLDWWRGFRSKELTEVIEEARAANLDIAAAVARIVQADAQARIAGAPLLPGVDLNGSATHSRTSQSDRSRRHQRLARRLANATAVRPRSPPATRSTSGARTARRCAPPRKSAVASRYDREVVGLATVVSVANAYFQVLAAQDRLRIARENVASATRILNLIKQQLAAGTASDARRRAAGKPGRTPSARRSRRWSRRCVQNRHALARLDRAPARARRASAAAACAAIAIPRVTPGLPSELLAQRPDIREAEAKLAAANANVVQRARAASCPASRSPARAATRARCSRPCCGRNRRSIRSTAGLTQPIFEGGKLLGNLDLQKGMQDELLQNYRKAVISAFADVDKRADRRAPDRVAPSGCSATWSTVRAGLSISPTSSCAPAPSTWSRCCRTSRHCFRPRMRWRRRGWRGCRRSSASIRRSAAAGCRSRLETADAR